MAVGSPRTSPATVTCICGVTGLHVREMKETGCIRVSVRAPTVLGCRMGKLGLQKADVGGIFSRFNHRMSTGRWPPGWAVTKLCLLLFNILTNASD